MDGIIVYLGAPNDDQGNLSKISSSRLDKVIEEYLDNKDHRILLTGGFGAHFNRTNIPHATYAKNYLLAQRIPGEAFLESIDKTSNTVDDAVLIKPVVDELGVATLVVVSSDFHIARAERIFSEIFEGYDLIFSGAETDLPKEEMEKRVQHEKKRLEEIAKNGLYY